MNRFLIVAGRLRPAILFLLLAAGSAYGETSSKGAAQDLRSRMQAAAAAQQAGDASAVADANKRVLALALHEMAGLHATLGLFASSVELCKRSLEFEESSDTRLSIAVAYTRLGRIDNALEQAGKVVAVDTANAAGWNLQGKLWMMKKDYKKAADALAKSLALQNDPEAAYTMATALLKSNQVEKAAGVFRRLQEASGDRAEGYILAARAYENANLNGEAEAEYKKAIAGDARASRSHYFLGLFYLTKNGWDPTPQAREEFLAEANLNPTDFFGNYFAGYVLSLEKNYEESDRYLRLAAIAKPDWPEPYLYMGLNAYGEGANVQAEAALRKAIALTGKDEARNNYQIRRGLFALGRILVITGRKEEGTKYLVRSREMENLLMDKSHQPALAETQAAPGAESAAIAEAGYPPAQSTVDPTAPVGNTFWDSASLSSEEKVNTQQSEKGLRVVIANAYNDLAASEARRREYELAVVHFHESERWDPKAPGLMRNLALAAFFSKNYTESARALKIVVAEDPLDQRSMSMLALSLFSIKDYAEAVKAFDRVGDAALSDPRMAYGWALSLAKTKDRVRTAAVLEKLVAQPIPPEMLVLAGQLYAEIGDRENAQLCYRRAKEKDPNIVLPR